MELTVHNLKHKFNLFFLFFIISVFSSQCFAQSPANSSSSKKFAYLNKFDSMFQFVLQNYVDEVDPKVLYEGAMKGMMDSLGDPYTSYLDEDTIRDLSDTTNGSFGGVGLSISKPIESKPNKPAYVEVASPIEDTPGAKAGILAGDYIIEVNGKPTESMTMDEVLKHLRGKVGESVKVTILRGKNLKFTVELVRALIEIPTVKYGMIGNTGYMRLIQFTPDIPERVQDALNSFKKDKNFKNLVIDLRDNPGGLITSAVAVADKFIDEGPIVTTKSRLDFENAVYKASKNKTQLRGIPMVVLINQGSASASEIVAGALKDNHLAYLVGAKSYGKGSVQQVIPLGASEEVKMTVARYYTPSDTNIDKVGIQPDKEVLYPKLTEDDEKNYSSLLEANVIVPYVEEHPDMTEKEIAAYAEELKKEYSLDSRLLRRIIRIQVNRTKPTALYDLDYDIQLNAALELLNGTEDFEALLKSTKTLKELQAEAEAKKAAELQEEAENSKKAE